MVSGDWRDVLGEGLAIDLELPWEPGGGPATSDEAVARLLDAIAVLEDGLPGPTRSEEPRPECQRLELKIEVLTLLLAATLRDRVPESRRLRLSREGLVVAASPDLGDTIRIYPCPWLPLPVALALRDVRTRDGHLGARWRSRHPEFRDALGRWVFRTHRRAMARQRLQDDALQAGIASDG